MLEDEGRSELTGLARPRADGDTAAGTPDDVSVPALDTGGSAGGASASTAAPQPEAPVAPPGSCPFLHLGEGAMACLAFAPAIALSARQVDLVCITVAHADCPRHLRGGTGERPVPPHPARRSPATTVDASAMAGADAPVDAPVAPWMPVFRAAEPDARATTSQGSAERSRAPEPAAVAPEPETLALGPETLASDPEPRRGDSDPMAGVHAAAPDAAAEVADGPFPVPAPDDEEAPAADPTGREPLPSGRVPYASAERISAPVITDASIRSRTETRADRSAGGAVAPRRIAALRSQAHDRSVALRPATAAASLTLLVAIVIALGFVATRGGLTLPTAAPSASGLAAGSTHALASGSPIAASATASAPASPSGSTSPGTSPTPSSPTASPTPPVGSPPASIAPDRLALLTPCPGKANCYTYRIARGDNLRTIAKFFAVPYQTILDLNPQIKNPSIIHIGDVITLPTPG